MAILLQKTKIITMKINLYNFKKYFFLYFFGFVPFGLISGVLAIFKVTSVEFNNLPGIRINGLLGILVYTIIFALIMAVVNCIAINLTNFYKYINLVKTNNSEKSPVLKPIYTYSKRKRVVEKSISLENFANVTSDYPPIIAN